jgi:urease accessory protein
MSKRFAILFPALLAASPVMAHTGHADGGSLVTGLLHPLLGLDHLLAMLAVGLWASRMPGRSRWLLPAAFVAMMAGGSALAWSGLAVPFVEPGIAASVLLLGLALAFSLRAPLPAAVCAVAVFALWHGAAHGQEMPAAAVPQLYAAGFVAATAALHALGVGLGARLRPSLLRAAGAMMAAMGASQLLFA